MEGGMKKGFTLSELLIVVSLIALIFAAIVINWRVQINRGHDVLRKKHLNDIKRAFEEYYNDKGCYPPASILSNCAGPDLEPYLKEIPCDPVFTTAYIYIPVDDSNVCRGYRVFTSLQDASDAEIGRQGCNGITGCGFGAGLNYGISSGGTIADPGFDPMATPTPTPGQLSGENICDATGECNHSSDPEGQGCTISYQDQHCCTTAACLACTTDACYSQRNACIDTRNWCNPP